MSLKHCASTFLILMTATFVHFTALAQIPQQIEVTDGSKTVPAWESPLYIGIGVACLALVIGLLVYRKKK